MPPGCLELVAKAGFSSTLIMLDNPYAKDEHGKSNMERMKGEF